MVRQRPQKQPLREEFVRLFRFVLNPRGRFIISSVSFSFSLFNLIDLISYVIFSYPDLVSQNIYVGQIILYFHVLTMSLLLNTNPIIVLSSLLGKCLTILISFPHSCSPCCSHYLLGFIINLCFPKYTVLHSLVKKRMRRARNRTLDWRVVLSLLNVFITYADKPLWFKIYIFQYEGHTNFPTTQHYSIKCFHVNYNRIYHRKTQDSLTARDDSARNSCAVILVPIAPASNILLNSSEPVYGRGRKTE